MSGGKFNYDQSYINYIKESVDFLIEVLEGVDTEVETYYGDDSEYTMNYVEDVPGTLKIFKEASKALEKAFIYAQRIDWFLSGDDGEEYFKKRLEEELEDYNKRNLKV